MSRIEEVEQLILENPGISELQISEAVGSYGVTCAYKLYNSNVVRSWRAVDSKGRVPCYHYAHIRTPISEIPDPGDRPMTISERRDSRRRLASSSPPGRTPFRSRRNGSTSTWRPTR